VTGTALAQALRREAHLHVIAITPKFDKIVRATAESAKVEAGSVLLPRNADFLDEFLGEIAAFPGGRHDDQVDSMTLFLNWIARRQFRESPRERPNPTRPLGRPIRERPRGAPIRM
jgi:predicted phage terminase large subunit-like protein